MPTEVTAAQSMEMLTPLVDSAAALVTGLSDEDWRRPSNCPPWDVAKLCAHMTRNGESLLARVQAILADDDTPPPDRPAMDAHELDLIAAGRAAMAGNLVSTAAAFRGLVDGCSAAQLELVSHDRSGRSMLAGRDVAWFATQRLAEVAFHSWDVRRSLGADQPLERALTEYLLAFMFSAGAPVSVARGSGVGVTGTFRLVCRDSGQVYRVTFAPDGRLVEPDPYGAADVSVEADAGWLALAAYGRVRLMPPEFSVTGPRDAAERFVAAFGSPPN
ncbi:MAG: maleylpyruvate isomerase family mycothiol-dependent enzyme [Chloroflexi bacterium]|nr:maleylpyruvate isomerase family mycothiol-dependent enzyme [Chloroflexota bacterium]